jgi:hypothetical protein
MTPARALTGPLFAWDPTLLVTGLLLAGVLLLGAVVIAWAGRWHRRSGPQATDPNEQLAQFRSLYQQGALSREEFERLRTLLGGQIRESLDVPAAAPVNETGVRTAPGTDASPPSNGTAPQPPPDGIRPA